MVCVGAAYNSVLAFIASCMSVEKELLYSYGNEVRFYCALLYRLCR